MENGTMITASQFIESRDAHDEDDEIDGVYLSDEEILQSFLMEGCDVDGTPLQLLPDRKATPAVVHPQYTLH
jgi:hypothetical protein